MAKSPPDRAKKSSRQPGQALNVVRGGAVCDPSQKGGHIMKGSMAPAVCMPTAGSDPRPRYRQAGEISSGPSRHSVQWAQHRKGAQKSRR